MWKQIRSLKPEDIQRARKFRKNMSESEHKHWQLLRHKGVGLKFRRQYPAGPYVFDFYCPQMKLCVELDGDLHGLQLERDARRDAWLADHGIQTFRITTAQLNPHPYPPPFATQKGEGRRPSPSQFMKKLTLISPLRGVLRSRITDTEHRSRRKRLEP